VRCGISRSSCQGTWSRSSGDTRIEVESVFTSRIITTRRFPLLGYASRLLSRTEVAQDTVAFRFERPKDFLFRAGQSIDLTVLGVRPDGSDCLTHTFSIASSPFIEEILIATRIRDSAFKRALSILPLGTHVNLIGPMGSFSLHRNTSKPAVFLAVGIGVTPFLSMLCSAAVDKARHNIFLFYANRYLEDAAFIDALWDLESSNTNFRFVQHSRASTALHGDGRVKLAIFDARCFPNT
jgi:ferredoxin-NADP reductase